MGEHGRTAEEVKWEVSCRQIPSFTSSSRSLPSMAPTTGPMSGAIFLRPTCWQGVVITIILSVFAQFVGSLIGLLLYFIRRSKYGALRTLAIGYITRLPRHPTAAYRSFSCTRSCPTSTWPNHSSPLSSFRYLGVTNQIPLDGFLSGCLALALNEGAYWQRSRAPVLIPSNPARWRRPNTGHDLRAGDAPDRAAAGAARDRARCHSAMSSTACSRAPPSSP